ncbi:MAG: hypothetical protein ACWGSD_18330 [Thermodesulfobacteriota bacterium]
MNASLSRIFRHLNPAQLAILSFGLVILVGAGMLMLPASSVGPSLGFVDALFMSTSATCVTGLVIVDPGTSLTVSVRRSSSP